MDERFLILLLVLPFLGSIVAAMLPVNARNIEAWLAGLIAFSGLVITFLFFPTIADGTVVQHVIPWLPNFGVNIDLRMDGFASIFSALITGIGMLVVLYARYYMSPEDPVTRFYSFLLGFMGSMIGIVLAGNLIQLVFFWELTSLYSFLLIGYRHHNIMARDGARIALTVTGAGGLCLFVGVLIIGHIVGSYELDAVLASGDAIRDHDLYVPALILVLLGAFTKSAQFPFHFWLPQAMAAPTPVSAYLHSATMVKAGVFLLARLWPVMAGTDEWFWIVGTVGLSTFLIGAYVAIFQQDLKGLLAYSTISHLGLITLMLGINTTLAAVAAIFHMMNHATFKASLFMAAGVMDHETGTRDIRRLSGLYRLMPITATLAMVAAAAMAGVPLLNGFLSKEMFFAETLETPIETPLTMALPYVATLAGAFSVAYSLRFLHGSFFGPPPVDLPREPHDPPRWMLVPVALLVALCLVVGTIPGITIGPALNLAVHAVLGDAAPEYSLAIWHGLTRPLFMSLVALLGGALLYGALQGYFRTGADGAPLLRRLSTQRIFDQVMVLLSWRAARRAEAILGTRRLQPQLRMLVLVTILAVLWVVYDDSISVDVPMFSAIDPTFGVLWLVGITCAIGAAHQAKYHRLAALILMGGAGLVTCITFAWFSAPDLALTQFLVEVVTTFLILLGLRWLPKRFPQDDREPPPSIPVRLRRIRDFVIAIVAGGGMAILAYMMMTRPVADTISGYFVERSYVEGGGTNIINVILVDFRGFDTMGEITVLGIVALTVFALLRRFRPAPDNLDITEQQAAQNLQDDELGDGKRGIMLADALRVPALLMRVLFPIIVTMAIYLFMRGHDMPGGGFVAGLTMSVAFILQYMANGARWVEARLSILPVLWIGFGLFLAAATGLGAWAFGYPFLTSFFDYRTLPWGEKMPVASALLFDLGVFVLVVGATVLILVALAHQSIRSYRPGKQAVPTPPEGGQ